MWFVPVALTMPEVSILVGVWKVDVYFLLTVYLLFHFMRTKRISKVYAWKYFLLMLFTLFLFLIQYKYIEVRGGVHLLPRFSDCRTVGTFGDRSCVSSAGYGQLVYMLILISFSFLLLDYLRKLSAIELSEVAYRIVLASVLFQLFLLFVWSLGGYPKFVEYLMVDQFYSRGHSLAFRFGIPRFSAGFSEPSFLASMIFMSIFVFLSQFSAGSVRLKRRRILSICILVGFLLFTTFSMFMVYCFCLSLLLALGYRLGGRKVLFLCVLLNLLVLLFLNSIYFLVAKDVFLGGLESVIARQYTFTDVSDLSILGLFFGSSLGVGYNFMTVPNLIVQFGILGTIGLFYLMFYRGGGQILNALLFFLLFLTVVPSFYYGFVYIFISFMLRLMHTNKVGYVY